MNLAIEFNVGGGKNKMKKRLSERVATEILEMVTIQKRFGPGDKLPNENEFCEELGVSRTTLRAAIQSLVEQGILEVKRGLGTFVSENMGKRNINLMGDFNYSNHQLKDLYELRNMVEPYSAYYAASRATEKELEMIFEYEHIIEEKLEKGEDCIEANRLFHNTIATAAHNEILLHFISEVNAEIVRLFQDMGIKQRINKHTITDHRMMMEFLKARDADGAMTAMRLHINHSIADYVKE